MLSSFKDGHFQVEDQDGEKRIGKIESIMRENIEHGGANVYLDLKWLVESSKNGDQEVFTDGPFRETVALKLYNEPMTPTDRRLVITSEIVGNTVTFSRPGDELISEIMLFGGAV